MKKPWLAGLLSFILAGIGQFYIGKAAAGFVFLILYIVGITMLGGVFDDSLILVGFVLFPIIWIVSIIHAVVAAKKINNHVTSGS